MHKCGMRGAQASQPATLGLIAQSRHARPPLHVLHLSMKLQLYTCRFATMSQAAPYVAVQLSCLHKRAALDGHPANPHSSQPLQQSKVKPCASQTHDTHPRSASQDCKNTPPPPPSLLLLPLLHTCSCGIPSDAAGVCCERCAWTCACTCGPPSTAKHTPPTPNTSPTYLQLWYPHRCSWPVL